MTDFLKEVFKRAQVGSNAEVAQNIRNQLRNSNQRIELMKYMPKDIAALREIAINQIVKEKNDQSQGMTPFDGNRPYTSYDINLSHAEDRLKTLIMAGIFPSDFA